jgi:hypothetical protein
MSLRSFLRWAKEAPEGKRDVLYKLVIKPTAHPGVLRELRRMNVTYATLLPGLDGLARSLATDSKIEAATGPLEVDLIGNSG